MPRHIPRIFPATRSGVLTSSVSLPQIRNSTSTRCNEMSIVPGRNRATRSRFVFSWKNSSLTRFQNLLIYGFSWLRMHFFFFPTPHTAHNPSHAIRGLNLLVLRPCRYGTARLQNATFVHRPRSQIFLFFPSSYGSLIMMSTHSSLPVSCIPVTTETRKRSTCC